MPAHSLPTKTHTHTHTFHSCVFLTWTCFHVSVCLCLSGSFVSLHSTERLTPLMPLWFQLKHSHQQPYSLLRLHPDLPITIHHCFYLPFARDGEKTGGWACCREKENWGWYWLASTCIETRYWFSFFFSNGKKCIVRPKEISVGIWGKRTWNEHPVHCCLLWIVYRVVVIELSEPGPSPICALLTVFGPSMYLQNISSRIWLQTGREVLLGAQQRTCVCG